MKRIVISSQKGGVGKTTTAAILAEGLARNGFRTLAADMDPQCNLTNLCDFKKLPPRHNMYGLMRGDCGAAECAAATQYGFDLIPGVPDISELSSSVSREYRLRRALTEVSDRYDAAVIDTPPSLGLLTVASLIAADVVIIPMSPDGFSEAGARQLGGTISQVKKNRNAGIRIGGILLTRTDRTKLTAAVHERAEQLAREIGTKVYETKIRQSVVIREAEFYRRSLLAGNSAAVKDCLAFVAEFIRDEL